MTTKAWTESVLIAQLADIRQVIIVYQLPQRLSPAALRLWTAHQVQARIQELRTALSEQQGRKIFGRWMEGLMARVD